MGEWKIEPVFAVRGDANAVRTPAGKFLPGLGLLISLGDGRAVEVTAEMLARADHLPEEWEMMTSELRRSLAKAAQKRIDAFMAPLIQQAQEARDVPNSAASGNACKVCGEPKLCDDCREDGNQRYGHEE